MLWSEKMTQEITEYEYDKQSFALNFDEVNAHLWSVLEDRTTGEARAKVISGIRGEGLQA